MSKLNSFTINIAAYTHLLMSIGAIGAVILFLICPDIPLLGRIIGVASGCGGCWSFGLEYRELKDKVDKEANND